MFSIKVKPNIRSICKKDIREMVLIERRCFSVPWSEADFKAAINLPNVRCYVALMQGQIAGFLIYQVFDKYFVICNLAVDMEFRRNGIGTLLMKEVNKQVGTNKVKDLEVIVNERSADAQLFFKSLGFQWVKTLHGFYQHSGDDAYTMKLRL